MGARTIHPESLTTLIAELDRAMAAPPGPHRCGAVKDALVKAAEAGAADLPGPCRSACDAGYARHLLHRDPAGGYSVVVMVWAAGQGTPLHDHDGRWCVECVWQGRIRVTSYSRQADAPDGLHRFRKESLVDNAVGEAGSLIPPHEYHRIENAGRETAMTVHVYEGEMTRCNAYLPADETGDPELYRRVEKELAYS